MMGPDNTVENYLLKYLRSEKVTNQKIENQRNSYVMPSIDLGNQLFSIAAKR